MSYDNSFLLLPREDPLHHRRHLFQFINAFSLLPEKVPRYAPKSPTSRKEGPKGPLKEKRTC